MATTGIEYVRVERTIPWPIEPIWAKIAAFGGLEDWADGVTSCAVEGGGVGAIRTVVRQGRTVRERLEWFDPAGHGLGYLILPPHALPAMEVRGTISLTAEAEARTHVAWRSHATDFAVPPQALAERIAQFYESSLDGLARLLEREASRGVKRTFSS